MKSMILATVLGLLLIGANAPAEASTLNAMVCSQVEVVEVMHPSQHWHRERRWNPPPPRDNRTVIEQRIEGRNENFAQEVLRLVNKERARVGIAPLRLADDLQAATAIRAREIVGYFSHTRPNGSDCFTAMKNRGRTCGENIAAGNSSASATVEQWMNSQGHRANILNPAFRELGIGYFYAKDSTYRHYWVQLFRG